STSSSGAVVARQSTNSPGSSSVGSPKDALMSSLQRQALQERRQVLQAKQIAVAVSTNSPIGQSRVGTSLAASARQKSRLLLGGKSSSIRQSTSDEKDFRMQPQSKARTKKKPIGEGESAPVEATSPDSAAGSMAALPSPTDADALEMSAKEYWTAMSQALEQASIATKKSKAVSDMVNALQCEFTVADPEQQEISSQCDLRPIQEGPFLYLFDVAIDEVQWRVLKVDAGTDEDDSASASSSGGGKQVKSNMVAGVNSVQLQPFMGDYMTQVHVSAKPRTDATADMLRERDLLFPASPDGRGFAKSPGSDYGVQLQKHMPRCQIFETHESHSRAPSLT
ncbi:unnamed protein product, partial [Amoebophrya sp. A25]